MYISVLVHRKLRAVEKLGSAADADDIMPYIHNDIYIYIYMYTYMVIQY